VYSVRTATFAASAVALVSLIKGYQHCDRLSNSLHRLLPLPRSDIRRKAGGASGRRLSVRQEMVHPVQEYSTLEFCIVRYSRSGVPFM
jgi:hypothetical protein